MVRSLNLVLFDQDSAGTSKAIGVDYLPLKTFQVIIDTSATVKVQASEDNENWYDIETHTATGQTVDNNARAYIRVDVTGVTGNVKVVLTAAG